MASRVANRVARDDVVIVNALRNKGIFAPAQRFCSPVTGLRAPHGEVRLAMRCGQMPTAPHGEARLARSLLRAATAPPYRAARAAGRRGIAGNQSTDDRREKRVYRLGGAGGGYPQNRRASKDDGGWSWCFARKKLAALRATRSTSPLGLGRLTVGTEHNKEPRRIIP